MPHGTKAQALKKPGISPTWLASIRKDAQKRRAASIGHGRRLTPEQLVEACKDVPQDQTVVRKGRRGVSAAQGGVLFG